MLNDLGNQKKGYNQLHECKDLGCKRVMAFALLKLLIIFPTKKSNAFVY